MSSISFIPKICKDGQMAIFEKGQNRKGEIAPTGLTSHGNPVQTDDPISGQRHAVVVGKREGRSGHEENANEPAGAGS